MNRMTITNPSTSTGTLTADMKKLSLNGDNYKAWICKITVILKARNLWKWVNPLDYWEDVDTPHKSIELEAYAIIFLSCSDKVIEEHLSVDGNNLYPTGRELLDRLASPYEPQALRRGKDRYDGKDTEKEENENKGKDTDKREDEKVRRETSGETETSTREGSDDTGEMVLQAVNEFQKSIAFHSAEE